MNRRWQTMRDYNGLLISREQRQIDCIQPHWTKLQTYDANIKIEIDLILNSTSISVSRLPKQQIVIDDVMWEKLQHNGKNGGALIALVRDLRHRRDELEKELKAKYENRASNDGPRLSVLAMEESENFLKGSVPEPTLNSARRGEEQYRAPGGRASIDHGQAEGQTHRGDCRRNLEATLGGGVHGDPQGPFYRPFRLGEQKRLVVNTDHPFYAKVYNAAPEVRAALEVLLFVLAERESGGNPGCRELLQSRASTLVGALAPRTRYARS